MLDITKFAAEETGTVKLLLGNDEPLLDSLGNQASITVYGPGSSAYQRAQAKQQNRAIERLKKRGKVDQSADEKLQEQAEYLASCTVSFNGFEYPGSGSGHEMFKAAYADPSIGFIAEQVGRFMGDWANFTKGSPGS